MFSKPSIVFTILIIVIGTLVYAALETETAKKTCQEAGNSWEKCELTIR